MEKISKKHRIVLDYIKENGGSLEDFSYENLKKSVGYKQRGSVYYAFKSLEKHGLLTVTETKRVVALTEKGLSL